MRHSAPPFYTQVGTLLSFAISLHAGFPAPGIMSLFTRRIWLLIIIKIDRNLSSK